MVESTFLLEDISPLEFYGVNNNRFKQFKELHPEIVFVARGNELKIRGSKKALEKIQSKLDILVQEIRKKGEIADERFLEILNEWEGVNENDQAFDISAEDVIVHGSHGNLIRARTVGQKQILVASRKNDIVFATGPAGTGKTYTAVALAVKALKDKSVKKIFLVRPAVEAGENLGFLPGDLKEKVDPYLRPLYDALEDMLHHETLKNYLERNIIEIAPLAYMRGRTLSKAYVILDEAQNATEMQLKMFLTRMGKESKIIITGDDSQIDLPKNLKSGLLQGMKILRGIEGIGFVRLTTSDVVRHKLVRDIIAAYKQGK